jgi:hypothetical protein
LANEDHNNNLVATKENYIVSNGLTINGVKSSLNPVIYVVSIREIGLAEETMEKVRELGDGGGTTFEVEISFTNTIIKSASSPSKSANAKCIILQKVVHQISQNIR